MIRVTKLTDYSIVLLTHMVEDGVEGVYNSRDLAADSRLPLPVVSKVLKVLTREGLLVSQRGVKGGYRLARKPDEISMAEVIHAMEGPIAMTECCSITDSNCDLELECKVRGNWNRINAAVVRSLSTISLAEMSQPVMPVRGDAEKRDYAGVQEDGGFG